MKTTPNARKGLKFNKLAISATALMTTALTGTTQSARAEPSILLPDVIISANRTESESDTVGSSVTVLTGEDLEKQGQTRLVDYLDRVPGVNISQTGTPGSQSTINIRGATAKYIQVRIDGIEISDPTTPEAAPDLSHLLVSDIARIEVLRGSQSALYGGEAVGGVIDITTKSARNTTAVIANAEGGSYGTGRGSITAMAGNDRADVTVTVQHFDTQGFSSANEKNGNTEDDGYVNTTLSAKGSFDISETFKLFAAARHTDYELDYDDGFSSPPADNGEVQEGTQSGVRGGAEFTLFDGRSWNEVSIQYFETDREYSYGTYTGTRTKGEYLGRFDLHENVRLTYGTDWTGEHAEDSFGGDYDTETYGVFGQAAWEPVDGLTLTGTVRHDEHSRFGGFGTFRLAAAYRIHPDTLIRASYGTGFRAPTISELYGFGGDPTLDPEESESFDIGIEQTLLGGDMIVSATFFALNVDNLIVSSGPPSYNLIQIDGVSKRTGIELAGQWAANSWLSLGANYTYTEAEDQTGERLPRVPLHDVGISADIRPTDRLLVTLSGTIVSDVIDIGQVPLDDYFLLNARMAYDVNDHVKAYVRAVNLLDQDYETSSGYGTAGFSVYAGLTTTLGNQ